MAILRLMIILLGLLQFSSYFASADSGEPPNDPGTAWCDERIRELETAFHSRLTNEVQSTQARADESCNHRLSTAEVGGSQQTQTANLLQARLAEMQTLLDTSNDRTNTLEGTIQELHTTQAEQSSSCALQLQEKMTSLQTQAARIQELESSSASCMNESVSMLQQQMDAVKDEHIKEMETRVVAAVQQVQEEHARKLKMVQDRRDALVEENAQMKSSMSVVKAQLQETKNELFEIRQELFHTHEKLREASRRWYQILLPAPVVAWLEQTMQHVSLSVQSTWKLALSSPVLAQAQEKVVPFLETLGIPAAWQKIQVHARPLAGMAWSVATTIGQQVVVLLQTARREMPVYFQKFVTVATRYGNEFVTMAEPKVQVAWNVTKDTSGRVWAQVREASQPLVDKIPWQQLEPHMELIKRLWNDLMHDTEWIRVEFAIYCSQAMVVLQHAPETIHRWAIDAFHYLVRTSHVLLKLYEAPAHVVDWTESLHAESETVIWYMEAALGTFVAMYIASTVLGFGGGRGRRGSGGKTFQADPAYSNGSAKKLERIAKRQTEKVAKKKQVQFNGH